MPSLSASDRLMAASADIPKERILRSFMSEPDVDVEYFEGLIKDHGIDIAFDAMLERFGKPKPGFGELREQERQPVEPVAKPGVIGGILEEMGRGALVEAEAREAAGYTLSGLYQGMNRGREEIVKSMIRGHRKRQGSLPDLYDFAAVVENNPDILRPGLTVPEGRQLLEPDRPLRLDVTRSKQKNRAIIKALYDEGRIPRQEDIREQFDEPYATMLIEEMRALSPKLVSPEASWRWRGEIERILPLSWITRHPYIAGAMDEAFITGTEFAIEELTDPKEWALDFVAGKFVVVPLIKYVRRSALMRTPISRLLRALAPEPRRLRQAVGKLLTDSGVADEVIDGLIALSDDELLVLHQAAREGRPVSITVSRGLFRKKMAAKGLQHWAELEPHPAAELIEPDLTASTGDIPPRLEEPAIPDYTPEPVKAEMRSPKPAAVTAQQATVPKPPSGRQVKAMVERSLQEGKYVPESVLGQYRDLDAKYGASMRRAYDLEKAPITESEVKAVIGDSDPNGMRSILQGRGKSAVSDEELLTDIGDALGKAPETQRLMKEYGASSVLDEMDRSAMRMQETRTALDEWRKAEGSITREALELEGQKGQFMKFGADRVDQPPIEDPDIKAALYAGRDSAGRSQRLKGWVLDKKQSMGDFVKAEFEPELKRAGEFQFRDDYRTGALPIPGRAREHVMMDFGNIWRGLNKKQIDTSLNIMGMRTWLQTLGEGLPIARKLSPEKIQAQLAKILADVQAKQPEILEAIGRYEDYARLVGQDLVARGKMPEEALKDFYFPHKVAEYLPDWWDKAPFGQKRVRQAFRPYTKTRAGSIKDIAISEQALYTHYAQVYADNAADDWAIKELNSLDIAPNLTPEQKLALFGKGGRVRPNAVYKIGDETYRGFQFVPGNATYKAMIADPKLLFFSLEDALLTDLDEANRIFRLPQEQQFDEVMAYLENVGPRGGAAVRIGRAIGGYNKTYLIREAIYDKMIHFKDQAAGAEWLYDLMGFTGWWKTWTLSPFAAGLPFQMKNVQGDFFNLWRTAPGAAKEVGTSYKILRNLRPEFHQNLTDWEKYVLRIAEDKDIFGSGFMREYSAAHPAMSAKGVMARWQRLGAVREAWLRLSMLSYQLKRVKGDLPLIGPEFQDVTKALDPESGAAYIAREFTTDYMAIPDWYRRYMRGLLFPFATFWQKNAVNWAKYTKAAPGGFITKFLGPMAAIWTYNNTIMGDVESKLGYWRLQPHLNLWKFDDTGDGDPNRAIILTPDLPIDMAAQFLGLNLIADKLTMIKYGYMTVKDAALQQLVDTGLATPKLAEKLMSPMIQVIMGLRLGRNPVTKEAIVPPELKNIPSYQKFRYWAPYVAESLVTPFGAYMRSAGADDALFGFITKPADLPHQFSKYVLNGPLDVPRGLGFRSINLDESEMKQMAGLIRDERGVWGKTMHRLEVKYYQSDQSVADFMRSPEIANIVAEAQSQNIPLDPVQVRDMLRGSRVQLRKYEQLIEKSVPMSAERRELEKQRNMLLRMRLAQTAGTIPKAMRKRLLDRVGKIQKKR